MRKKEYEISKIYEFCSRLKWLSFAFSILNLLGAFVFFIYSIYRLFICLSYKFLSFNNNKTFFISLIVFIIFVIKTAFWYFMISLFKEITYNEVDRFVKKN